MLFICKCKSMIDPDSEGYLSDFSDFDPMEASGPKVGSKPTKPTKPDQIIIRNGYIDNAVSNEYPIGYTSRVTLKKWKIGIVTRKTNNNVYVYFLKMKHRKDRKEINCLISKQDIDNQKVNGTQMSLRRYQPFTIGDKQLKWNELITFMKQIKTEKVFVALTLQTLDNLQRDIGDAFKRLIQSRTNYDIKWVKP